MLCYIQTLLEKSFPFSWVGFAADVAELYAAQSKFVEGTDAVFRWHWRSKHSTPLQSHFTLHTHTAIV